MIQIPLDTIRTDGNTQPRVGLSEDAVRDYALDLLEGHTFPPIVVYHDGTDSWLAAGFHRLAAAMSIGLTHLDAVIHQGGPREAFLFAVDDNRRNGVRYTNADKRAMVDRFVSDPDWARWADREIARRCGLSHEFVRQARPSLSTVDSDIRTYIDKYGNTSTMNVANIGRAAPVDDQVAIGFADDDEDDEPIDKGGTSRIQHVMRVMGSSESPEWYTPAYIISHVQQVFPVIHVDPCSNSHENPNVPAEVVYTKEDNGLNQQWNGNVYMNPPYGDEIGPWIDRMVSLHREGKIQAIALLPARIDTAWFQPLYDYPMCNIRGRVRFLNAENSAPFPSVAVYLGPHENTFIEAFKSLGPIVKRIA
jgi:hypothetical protein